ncbi:hypothetical protein [Pseudomonas laurylsulfatiphila]|uniref:hypothetical protein n=1 Tax=Pseudomonas laurylsulfatiphila TaxID=2011015 RepID=UPI003D1B2FA8
MVVNDDDGYLNKRGASAFLASKLAPAGTWHFGQADCRFRLFPGILAGFQKFANECCPSWKSTRS